MMYGDHGWMWGGGHGWCWGGNGWGWGGIVMTVVLVVLLVAVIIALVFAIRYLSRSGSHYNRASSEATRAEDALAQRFARGEIDEDEYRRRMTLLREHR